MLGARISTKARPGACFALVLAALCAPDGRTFAANPGAPDAEIRHTYFTGGVHNDVGCTPPSTCIYRRHRGQLKDPRYPKWWTSGWIMYRVFRNHLKYPPPYASPPKGLTPNDYEVSRGATYYDSAYVAPDGDGTGAVLDHYEHRCLPIFPASNRHSCTFVSLGNKTYLLRQDDRPPGTPQCCIFSKNLHAPRQDFIKHLDYSAGESRHLGGTIQAYSIRMGAYKVLFGFAFYKAATRDRYARRAYRHPQSFYFSGFPTDPPNAPIVSRNYTNFRMQRPSRRMWKDALKMCPADPPWCCEFDADCPSDHSVPEAVPQTPALQGAAPQVSAPQAPAQPPE